MCTKVFKPLQDTFRSHSFLLNNGASFEWNEGELLTVGVGSCWRQWRWLELFLTIYFYQNKREKGSEQAMQMKTK